MTTIFLIGFMACGKTTLGMAVAQKMGVPFIDLDDYIEERCEMTIAQIFSSLGERRFREIEREALRQVATLGGAIVACGGGTPCQPGNMQLMNSMGVTIWLTASPQCIVGRLLLPGQKAKRPVVAAVPDGQLLPFVTRKMQERQPWYAQAMLHFDSSRLETLDQINATATRFQTLLQGL